MVLIFSSAGSLTSIQASIELPESMEYQDTKLTLNGQGTRVMFFVKIYESGKNDYGATKKIALANLN